MLLNQRTILWGSSDIMRMTANHWRKITQINGDYTHTQKQAKKKNNNNKATNYSPNSLFPIFFLTLSYTHWGGGPPDSFQL